jgi:hypothetical protein
MKQVTLTHPKLNAQWTGPESAAKRLEDSGWKRAPKSDQPDSQPANPAAATK